MCAMCVCVWWPWHRWREAHEVGKAPPLFLNCTNMKALEYVPLEVLKKYAVDADEAAPQ